MKELFRAKPEVKFEQILTYVITWHMKTVPNVVRQVHDVSMSLVDVVLSAADALKTHFLVGQSYALFWRFASALSVSPKKKFVMSPEDVGAYRDGLDNGQIEIFQNHLGQTTGRA